MEKILLHGSSGDSLILLGVPLSQINTYLSDKKTVIITDEEVYRLYTPFFAAYPTIIISRGEEVKSLTTITTIYEQLTQYSIDRSSFILGVGGGLVCDITGFVASTYLRGLSFGFVPTTLLAQVDASVGGKNGINFKGLKNRIGTFNQPEIVLCDPAFFQTLPEREFRCGLGEIVKHALIADASMFDTIENHIPAVLSRQPEVLQPLVSRSVQLKTAIVDRDEKEQGERRLLNFGHTVGHIVEERSALNHGEAVAVGMAIAARMSCRKGILSDRVFHRILGLMAALELPLQSPLTADEIIAALGWDKKREGNDLYFVFLKDIGQAIIEKLPITQLQALIRESINQ